MNKANVSISWIVTFNRVRRFYKSTSENQIINFTSVDELEKVFRIEERV